MAPTPNVSVVIPTFNRQERLHRVLTALAAQTYPRTDFEVIVVSDGSTDGTDQYLTSDRPPLAITALTQPNQGPAAARNAGAARAHGMLLLFIDDDVVPGPDLIAAHVLAHEAHGPNYVVIGPMLSPTDFTMSPWVAWEQAMLYKQYDAMDKGRWGCTARQFYTGNASLAREVFVASGGFDPTFRRAEDVELAYRLESAGISFVFEPSAVGSHYAERSFSSWRANASAYGRNDAVFGRDQGHEWLLAAISEEFRLSNPINRWVTLLSLRAPWLHRPIVVALGGLSRALGRLRWARPTRYALSGLFSLLYHRALADELGGFEVLSSQRTSSTG